MHELSVDVGDGRMLGYREFGAPDGRPVINCHGGLLCGLDIASFGDAARELGMRIISPDRPGIALSDPAPGRYALACAAKLDGRITRTVVIAGAVPLDNEGAFGELNAMDRRFTRLSEHHPHVASTMFKTLGEIARHAPDVWAHLTARSAVPEEATAIESLPDPGIAEAGARALEHGEGHFLGYRHQTDILRGFVE